MRILLSIVAIAILLTYSSCCVFKGNCALKRNPQKDKVEVGRILDTIRNQYYSAVKQLNDRLINLNLQNCTVSLSNCYTATKQGGIKFFIGGATYQHAQKTMSTVSFTLSAPPPPPSGGERAFVNPNDTTNPFPNGSLAAIIFSAAQAFHNSPNFGILSSHSITIDNSFTVDNQGTLSVSLPIGAFTPSAQGTLDFQNGNEIKLQFSVCDMCDQADVFFGGPGHGAMGCSLLSASEFKDLQQKRQPVGTRAFLPVRMPDSLYLNTPPVGNQGKQNSCVGWAVGYTYMGTILHKQGDPWRPEDLTSPSFVYNQIEPGGCKPSRIQDALDLISVEGDCRLQEMSYVDTTCAQKPNADQRTAAGKVASRVGKWYTVDPNNVEEIKRILVGQQPVIVGFPVTMAFENMWANGGVWTRNCSCGSILGGHCVCIIGYNERRQQFKVQNQWGDGDKQGDGGFFWVNYDLVKSGCFSEAYAFEKR